MKRSLVFLVSAFLAISALSVSAFAQGGGVKGKVRGQNGKGIANATITARQDGKDIKAATSDAKGEFTMTGLSAGKYNFAIDASGYSTGVLYGVEVRDGIRKLGDNLILSVDRGSLVMIRGSVFFKEGNVVTGAKIELELVNADGSTKKLASETTDIFGEFKFQRLEGAAKLRVTAKLKNATASKEIEVYDAAIYRVAITLPMSAADR